MMVNNTALDQGWFERSGVCGQAWLLLLLGSTSKDFPKLFPVGPIFQRRFMVARSQAKLNKQWCPPRIYIGELYANTLKTCSLGLAYGPLYPSCYLLTAFALVFCNLCTSYGISRWYARPPAVNQDMMMALRRVLSIIVLFQVRNLPMSPPL